MDSQSYNVTEAIKKIKAVVCALDDLEVKGRDNLNILLGSIQALERSVGVIESVFNELNRQPEVELEVVSSEE